MNFNEKGLSLLKKHEGCRLTAYPDPATGGKPWTIGYGGTEGVIEGMAITQDEAEKRLTDKIGEISALLASSLRAPLNDNQFSALICFAYNVRDWKQTPLFQLIDCGDFKGAEAHWPLYCKANGQEMQGLKNRRLAELALFKEPCSSAEEHANGPV